MASRKNVRTAAVGLAAVVLIVAAVGGYLLLTGIEEPTVQSVESELGPVSNETTTVHSRIVVLNPNDRSLSDATVHYTVRFNDVEMGTGSVTGVRLSRGRNVIDLSAELDHDRVPDWWVTHVGRNETTNLTTRAAVSLPALPFAVTLPGRHRPLETDFLGGLTTATPSNMTLGNETLLRVGERQGSWGEPTAERTPLTIQTPLANRHNRTVALDGLAYTVRMNGVVVGEGVDEAGFTIEPGTQRTVTVDAHIDPDRMQRWWISHFGGDQTTNLSVSVAGVIDREDGREELPLPSLGTRADFATDVFGNQSTTISRRPAPPGLSFERPSVDTRTSAWGEPTDRVTPIVTTVRGRNPNVGPVADVLRANVSQTMTIGDHVVAANRTVTPLSRGEYTVTARSTMRNDEVPTWWAAHLNRGEYSRTHTAIDGEADVGLTTFPLRLADRNGTVETDVLGGLSEESSQSIRVDGRRALTVEWTRASWQTATPERATARIRMRVRNRRPVEASIRELNYSVRIGNATLADRESPDEWTFEAGETRTITTTLVVNNSRMADWWPDHVRRDERSNLVIESFATIASGDHTERRRLDVLSDDRVVETDVLGPDEG